MQAKWWMLTAAVASGAWGCASSDAQGVLLERHDPLTVDAGVDLVALGTLSGNQPDRSRKTAAALENGVAGNLLGGLGSGIAYAGNDTFVAVPDRGPNAASYDSAIDDTTSFIARFQTLRLKLSKSPQGAALPLQLTPVLKDTTLLYDRQPLTYGTGAGLGVGGGAPLLNDKHHFYLTGRSDNFDPALPSNAASDARFDPESVRVANDGERIYVSDEYGPFVYEFDRDSGQRLRTFTLPSDFAVARLSPQGDVEISSNTSGRVANKGMEGLALTPDGKTLIGAMQSPLLQDGATSAPYLRLVELDIASGATSQYVYALTNIGTASKPKYPTVSDIVAVNSHEFLVDERDGKGLGDDSTAVFKHIYHIDLTHASDVSGLSGQEILAAHAVDKTLFLDIVAVLNAHGIASNDIPAKLEGLAFGQDVRLQGVRKHTLFVANDNDFIGTVTDTNHLAGIDNPNKFFVFAFSDQDLPGLVQQRLAGAQSDLDE